MNNLALYKYLVELIKVYFIGFCFGTEAIRICKSFSLTQWLEMGRFNPCSIGCANAHLDKYVCFLVCFWFVICLFGFFLSLYFQTFFLSFIYYKFMQFPFSICCSLPNPLFTFNLQLPTNFANAMQYWYLFPFY